MQLGLSRLRVPGRSVQCRTVGHALLVHPAGEPDPRAVAFTAGLAADPQHTLVFLDLPAGSHDSVHEPVVKLLANRPGSLRLVFAQGTPHEVRRAAQRIAERLNKLVVAPDGEVLRTANGGLFVPTDHGLGWLRFRPGRGVERDSMRFPKPRWEFSTIDRPWAVGPETVAEPVPSGVWVRSARLAPAAAVVGRQLLMNILPGHPDILTVVLGNPAGPVVPLADVSRFWDMVLPSVPSWARFIPYGPVSTRGDALGQELADALRQQVVLYAGMPVEAREGLHSPEVYGVRQDGSLGWRSFVSEMMYFPRTGSEPPPPSLFGVRAPLVDAPEISAGVYEFASDAVLEVVQCGLWMRPSAEPANGNDIRRLPPGPGRAAILYDRSTPQTAERMRSLAEDMLWRLDPATRDCFRVAPADDPRLALTLDDEEQWSRTVAPTERVAQGAMPAPDVPSAQTALRSASAAPAVQATGEALVGARVEHAPSSRPSVAPPPTESAPPPGTASVQRTHAESDASAPIVVTADGAPQTAQSGPGAAIADPVTRSATAPPASPHHPPVAPPAGGVAHREQNQSDEAPGSTQTSPPVPTPHTPALAPLAAAPSREAPPIATPEDPPVAPVPRPLQSVAPRIRLESAAPQAPTPEPDVRRGPDADLPKAGTSPTATPVVAATAAKPTGSGEVRVQLAPKAAACGVPPERGIEREREWVRRNFSEQYNAVAGSVSRVMSESPGLRGLSRTDDADALTDLAAVRLYLSGDTRLFDEAVRGATAGPHVPLARCVAAGLRRLPSYRGPALLRATLSAAERSWYGEGELATEWGFCTARTTMLRAAAGDGTGFLIWSMTARRTNLLDPAAPDRVLFLPGTAFKVLRIDHERNILLLREVSSSEIAEDGLVDIERVPLDEIAIAGLERAVEALEEPDNRGTPPARLWPDGTPPGLIVTSDAPMPSGMTSLTLPDEGAKP
ncbi:hypothetical protein OG422_25500 [Streptomyces sp. NBC_01525]|uniref:hypothetical protein n=1 Tax=Streptomyces sp. NBC_01525 TaxID=2903893 RepID=UPI003864770D